MCALAALASRGLGATLQRYACARAAAAAWKGDNQIRVSRLEPEDCGRAAAASVGAPSVPLARIRRSHKWRSYAAGAHRPAQQANAANDDDDASSLHGPRAPPKTCQSCEPPLALPSSLPLLSQRPILALLLALLALLPLPPPLLLLPMPLPAKRSCKGALPNARLPGVRKTSHVLPLAHESRHQAYGRRAAY